MKLTVNGVQREVDVEGDTPLLWVLREELGLTGTKFGCGIAVCGACTVHIDGVAQRSCALPVSLLQASQKITTIEGLAENADHPVQQAWAELDVPQCGYCQSGMMMAAASLLSQNPSPSEAQIRSHITNICRCGTYPRVLKGVQIASEHLANKGAAPQNEKA